MRSWKELRALGHQRCVFGVVQSRPAMEFPSQRTPGKKKGRQCNRMVSRERRAERGGIAICAKHWPIYLKTLEEGSSKIRAVRTRLDPGPLPLDEED